MKSPPLIVDSIHQAGRPLTRMNVMSNDARSEAWLQELLYSHPELLPVDRFGDSFSPAIAIGREVRTNSGPLDNLYVSPLGGITIVETKLWKNPEKHRTVVAQIIDYAKELATWDYDRFCQAILTSSRKRGEREKLSLEEKVATTLGSLGIQLHEFQESVAAALSEGAFLLLIVGDRISPNIALLTSAIQSAPGLRFTLGLTEMQLYQVAEGRDWPLLVVPEVIGRTVEQERAVVRVQYRQEKPSITVTVEEGVDGDNERQFFELIAKNFKDLVEPLQEGAEEWRRLGGEIRFTDKTMFFEATVAGTSQKIVRCRWNQINVIRRKTIDDWGADPGLYDIYLDELQSAPSVLTLCRTDDRMWISFDDLSASDMRALLRAATELVRRIMDAE